MATYFDVRGFLDCDFEQVSSIGAAVEEAGRVDPVVYGLTEDAVQLYSHGWHYQDRRINWSAHVFFGASMRSGGVDFILDTLRAVAERHPQVTGRFFIDDQEGGESAVWLVRNGEVLTDPR
jgi:hypothetical protein